MPFYGSIVVIKRSGADGSTFPLINEECLLGRAEGCDIRIQLPIVSKEHAKLKVKVQDNSVFIVALSRTNNTKLNGSVIDNESQVQLFHEDQFTIGDRHFRWEYPTGSRLFQVKRPAPASSPVKTPAASAEVPISKRIAELEAEGTPNNRKRVSFGHYISPELFDKDLPPDTPVRKGAVPVSELKKGASLDSPRPGALARSLAIKRSTSTNTPSKRPSVAPSTPGIPEESSPKGVLKRQENDLPPTKVNSGYRSSPRTSTGSDNDGENSPKTRRKSQSPVADSEVDDANQAKTSKIQTTSPRKDLKVLAKKTTPAKVPTMGKLSSKSPRVTPAKPVVAERKSKTPTLPVKRKSAVSPPSNQTKKRRVSAPGKVVVSSVQTPDTKRVPKKALTPKTPMVKTPVKGQTPTIKTPADEILKSSVRSKAAKTPKTPMVSTPPKGFTPTITTPKDAILESPGKSVKVSKTESKVKTPKSVAGSKTPKVGKTPKSTVKKPAKSLYSDILKKNLSRSTKKTKVARVEKGKITKPQKKAKVQVKSPEKRKVKAESSTGHANSPENIVIGRRTPKVKAVKKTPKMVKTPRSVAKKLGVGTPAVNKSIKKTLWSEVVKKNLGKTPKKGKISASSSTAASKLVKKTKPVAAVAVRTPTKQVKSLITTGHANSPAPIIITKRKQKAETPVLTKKGRKSDTKKAEKVPDNTNYEGVSEMMATPEIVVTAPSPRGRKSSEKRYPQKLSIVETHKRIGRKSISTPTRGRQSVGSPLVTPQNKIINKIKAAAPASEKGKRRNSFRGSPSKNFLSQSLSLPGTPGDVDTTNFDFDSVETPTLPVEMLVSPMVGAKSPKNDLTDVGGVKKLMRTPRAAQKSPKNDLSDVRGVKKLVATPGKKQKQPKNDLTDVAGVKKLMKTPRAVKQPKNDLSDVRGVKKLLGTPKSQKAPKNELSDVGGVKQLLGTPKRQNAPKNELSDLVGVKKMLRTPKNDKGPKNDLSNVAGVKALMATPKTPFNSPVANYSDVQGVKKLLKTPGPPPKSPRNVLDDLTGVSDLVKTPKSGAVEVVEGPSTSKAGKRKRKAETEAEADNVGSATKKAKVDGSTTSSGGTSRAKSSAKTRSPSKTTRGGKVSPKMDIPKFSLDDVEQSPVVVKAVKATRGRKAAVNQDDEVAQEEKKTPAPRAKRGRKVTDPVSEEKEETPAPKARRGRKAAESVVEEKEETPAPKARRGRKVAEPIVEEKEETPAPKARRGRKAAEPASEEKDETPAPKAKRGRKAAEPVAEEKKEETPAPKASRGRKPAEPVSVEKEEEVVETPAPKAKRGRKAAAATPAVETADKSVTADEPLEAPKSTRGRKKKETVTAETPSEVKSTARRGRGKTEASLEATITKQPPKSRLVEEPEAEATPKKGRGRAKKKEEEVAEAPVSPPKRGRKKKSVEAEEVAAVEAKPKRGRKAAKAVEEPAEEEVKATPAKRGRPAKTPVEEKEPTSAKKPAGRRGKKAEPEPEVEVEVEETKPAKRGRKKAPVTPEEEQEKISPVKPRGRAAAKKATEKSKSDLEDMSNLSKKKRRPSKTPVKGSKRKAEEEVDEVEPPKKTRSRRK